jgi:hypothetical protein
VKAAVAAPDTMQAPDQALAGDRFDDPCHGVPGPSVYDGPPARPEALLREASHA